MRPVWSNWVIRTDRLNSRSLQAAYVLHTRRYGDSSLIVDLLTRDQGRVACIAKGVLRARRPDTRIQSFQRLLIELRGRGEVLSLVRAESAAPPLQLRGRNLYCGLYVNELVLKLTARQDACPELFDDYALAIEGLGGPGQAEPTLRRFEVRLLRHMGLGLSLELDAQGQSIEPDRRYTYDLETGPVLVTAESNNAVGGGTLRALQTGVFEDEATLQEARHLMRRILNHYLDGRPLHSRELFR